MFEKLTEAGAPLDIRLFDEAVMLVYSPTPGIDVQYMIDCINNFSSRVDILDCGVLILESTCSLRGKFIALSALHQFIRFCWNSIDDETKNKLKYLFLLYLHDGQEDMVSAKVKAAEALAEIAKFDWPEHWASFIEDMFTPTENIQFTLSGSYMAIKMLIETINDPSTPTKRAEEMKSALAPYLPLLMQQLEIGLDEDSSDKSIFYSVDLLISMVPLLEQSTLFESSLMMNIFTNYLCDKRFVLKVLGLVDSLVSLPFIKEEFQNKVPALFHAIVTSLTPQMDSDRSTIEAQFVNTVPELIKGFHSVIKRSEFKEDISKALMWMFEITTEGDQTMFESCLDFWLYMSRILLCTTHDQEMQTLFAPYIPTVQKLLVVRMPCPYEIIEVMDDEMLSHKQFTDNFRFDNGQGSFTSARELSISLSHTDRKATLALYTELVDQISNGYYDQTVAVSVAWSIAALSGNLSSEEEDTYLSRILVDMFSLVVNIDSQDFITSLLYLCGQYVNFMSRHFFLLKTFVFKILDILPSANETLQFVAAESLKNLVSKAPKVFMSIQSAETEALSVFLLRQIPTVLTSVYGDVMLTLVSIMSQIISNFDSSGERIMHADILFKIIVQQLNECSISFDTTNADTNMKWTYAIKASVKAIQYLPSLSSRLFQDILDLFINLIREYTNVLQEPAEMDLLFCTRRAVKNEVINAIGDFFLICESHTYFRDALLPQIVPDILEDYKKSTPASRTPAVLNLFSSIITKAPSDISENFQIIFSDLIEPTWEMICENFTDYEQMRLPFIKLLQMLIRWNTSTLMSIDISTLATFVRFIEWGCMHPVLAISEESTVVLQEFITYMQSRSSKMEFSILMEHMGLEIFFFAFRLITDSANKCAFQVQLNLLRKMCTLPFIMSQASQIYSFMCENYPSLDYSVIFTFIQHLFEKSCDNSSFKTIVSSFIVSSRHITKKDLEKMDQDRDAYADELKKRYPADEIGTNLSNQDSDTERQIKPLALALSKFFIPA